MNLNFIREQVGHKDERTHFGELLFQQTIKIGYDEFAKECFVLKMLSSVIKVFKIKNDQNP